MNSTKKQKGMALVLSMIFIMLFSLLAVSMATITGSNLNMAHNQQKSNSARYAAQSGLEVIRYWLNDLELPGGTDQRLESLAQKLQDTYEHIDVDYQSNLLTINNVNLDSQTATAFSAQLTAPADDTLNVRIQGTAGDVSRPINVQFDMTGQGPHPIWNYGVATRGPVTMTGNSHIEGVNDPSHGSVFIDATQSNNSFYIDGSCSIAGPTDIVNPSIEAFVWSGNPKMAGMWIMPWSNSHNNIENLIRHEVTIAAQPMDFPIPYPEQFKDYATGPVITESMSSVYTLDNAYVTAGANPHFTGVVTINGLLYIEQPNTVTFGGSVQINGFIVAAGDYQNPLPQNSISFGGNVQTSSVENLPNDPAYYQIRDKTGISILAPGFELNIGATFDSHNGSIVGNGINFTGNPQVTVAGSIINYSDEPLTMAGSTRLRFLHDDIDKDPAGFISGSDIKFEYLRQSYAETEF